MTPVQTAPSPRTSIHTARTINCVARHRHTGTVTFWARFAGMRRAQEFTVYPLHADQADHTITVKGDTYIGRVNLTDGAVSLAGPFDMGACHLHLACAYPAQTLEQEDLFFLKTQIPGVAEFLKEFGDPLQTAWRRAA